MRSYLALCVGTLCLGLFCRPGMVSANNTFEQATILPPGVLSVDDVLYPGGFLFPDTVLGIRGTFGFITTYNIDGGPYASTYGSGLANVPVNNDGSISFVISGWPDHEYFDGYHDEYGDYQVYVEVRDQFGWVEDSFDAFGSLEPGVVNQYHYSGFNTNYDYDVWIDNTVGGVSGGDVDFYTFTGLNPGDAFTAETRQLGFTQIDTYLGWFDDSGNLLEANDDISFSNLYSRIEGQVPASGQLTFAVTGYEDESFVGSHTEDGPYTLALTVDSSGIPGDFNNDGIVDGQDLLLWQRNPALGSLSAWEAGFGASSLSAVVAVPEPNSLVLLAAALVISCVAVRHRKERPRRARSLSDWS